MPINYKDYPKDWEWLSKQIIARADNKCELCFAPNHVIVWRIKGADYPWHKVENAIDSDTKERGFVKIVLTVHHIDFDKTNSNEYNLIALCQRCHLRLDLAYKIKNRKKAKELNKRGKYEQ